MFVESRNLKTAVCSVKASNTKLFWKYWTKSDHKHLIRSHSWNMCKGVSSHKVQKEHRLYSKKMMFLNKQQNGCLRAYFEIIACRYYTKLSVVAYNFCPVKIITIKHIFEINLRRSFVLNFWNYYRIYFGRR